MMRFLKTTLLLLLCILCRVWATDALDIDKITELYKNFDYEQVIKESEHFLKNENLPQETRLAILEMKAISHYSLLQMNKAYNCFVQLLNEDENFALDPVKTSPKIVSFFNDIKDNFVKQKSTIPVINNIIKTDTVFVTQTTFPTKSVVKRSLVIPGWGHIYCGQKVKGSLLTTLGIASAATATYFTITCRDKEKDYLNETNKTEIQEKYDTYNNAYKMRNISIATFAAVWLYSQIDILHFNQNNNSVQISVAPLLSPSSQVLSCRFSF